ncbi:MAG: phosphatidate cytidylyltransferase [Candidatus Obscuribacterales bacterium]|jgi:phosphatidate cytidylyltransferase|nr:phosphatidate cytidylyltransferase [Candidatus Obscuribacterales bacterium]
MWISNPLTNGLFLPLASTLSCLLSVGLLGVLAGRHLTIDTELQKQLILRWFSWLAISIIGLSCALAGPIAFAALTGLVALVGTWEYCKISRQNREASIVLYLFALAMPMVTLLRASFITPAVFLGFVLLALVSLFKAEKFDQMALSILGIFYVPFLASHMVALYSASSGGVALVLSVIASSALANIMAFVFGKVLKGPKLASAISPNKTLWGALGSIFGAYLGFMALSAAGSLSLSTASMVLIPLTVALSGILGDLFESSLKRYFQVKDAGVWLPGFGGALDRIDGLLFVIPSVYYLTRLLSGV